MSNLLNMEVGKFPPGVSDQYPPGMSNQYPPGVSDQYPPSVSDQYILDTYNAIRSLGCQALKSNPSVSSASSELLSSALSVELLSDPTQETKTVKRLDPVPVQVLGPAQVLSPAQALSPMKVPVPISNPISNPIPVPVPEMDPRLVVSILHDLNDVDANLYIKPLMCLLEITTVYFDVREGTNVIFVIGDTSEDITKYDCVKILVLTEHSSIYPALGVSKHRKKYKLYHHVITHQRSQLLYLHEYLHYSKISYYPNFMFNNAPPSEVGDTTEEVCTVVLKLGCIIDDLDLFVDLLRPFLTRYRLLFVSLCNTTLEISKLLLHRFSSHEIKNIELVDVRKSQEFMFIMKRSHFVICSDIQSVTVSIICAKPFLYCIDPTNISLSDALCTHSLNGMCITVTPPGTKSSEKISKEKRFKDIFKTLHRDQKHDVLTIECVLKNMTFLLDVSSLRNIIFNFMKMNKLLKDKTWNRGKVPEITNQVPEITSEARDIVGPRILGIRKEKLATNIQTTCTASTLSNISANRNKKVRQQLGMVIIKDMYETFIENKIKRLDKDIYDEIDEINCLWIGYFYGDLDEFFLMIDDTAFLRSIFRCQEIFVYPDVVTECRAFISHAGLKFKISILQRDSPESSPNSSESSGSPSPRSPSDESPEASPKSFGTSGPPNISNDEMIQELKNKFVVLS